MDDQRVLRSARFYGILDTDYVSANQWLEKFEALVNGGAKIVQVRAKKEDPHSRRILLEQVLSRSKEFATDQRPIIIVNDDVALAAEFPGVGLHIGQDDTPPAEARRHLGVERIIGLSTHSIRQAQAAMDLAVGMIDYFAVGPVFATQTKPDYEPVGLELVKWVAGQNPSLPFFCIGGINRENAAQVAAAGAKRVVTVSDALLASDTAKAVQETERLLGK